MSTGIPHKRLFLISLFGLAFGVSSLPAFANAYLKAWPPNRPIPELKLPDLEEKPWDLAALRGKVIVLNFWATWCESCVEEVQFLNELSEDNVGKGKLVILGVNFKESPSLVRQFSMEHKFAYPVLLDRSGDAFKKWGDGILPMTVLIDRTGKPRWKITGAIDTENKEFRQTLEKLLKQ